MSGSEFGDGAGNSVNSSCAASSSKGGHSSSSESAAEGEEQEDFSSSNLAQPPLKVHEIVRDELSNLRQLWKKDINDCQNKIKDNEFSAIVDEENNKDEEITKEAEKWFLEGVENEKNETLEETLIDRIEIWENDKEKQDEDEDEGWDLMSKLQHYISRSKSLCTPGTEQKMTHISSLPMEILLYILRWVVSSDLDMRSLEMCSMVCRGFYVCSRDPEIWRLACFKVWGVNCRNLKANDSWRTVFLTRPRVNFNGCYISKTSYIRHGENSFQDRFYRPCHLVEYYRYFRFFPEGIVFMITTPDEPSRVIYMLKGIDKWHPSILSGHYWLENDIVFIDLNRGDFANNIIRKRWNNLPPSRVEQTYGIELQITNRKPGINNCLVWKRYSVLKTRGNIISGSNFDVKSNKFPSLWFSRVKSYSSISEKPLL